MINSQSFNVTVIVGSIIAYAGNINGNSKETKSEIISNIESFGWLLCEGQSLQKDKYPELYGAIGDTYSNGSNDKNTFNIPNLRGSFLGGNSEESLEKISIHYLIKFMYGQS